jgi:hypothetical protein
MYVAFPRSDYYENSAPSSGHQQTACLAAADLAGRREGDPTTVPTFTTNR